ncbi:sulfatase [uncultured Alistipes sp.]|uniref:sulfatase family protein n=1 Tax=uncultured Alistipes sp. TaxID=538949 RepID=UPI0028048D72|nr:sulfatase [uncultured Alistipes sp.]
MKPRLLFPAVAAVASLAACDRAATPDLVNFILINLDDAGNGDFSFSGAAGYTTPNIDRLVSEGMRYTHFYAVQPISGASRAGLLTGCYPNRIGFAHAPGPGCPYGIADDEETIAEVLRKRDYATAIFGKWHLGDAGKFLPLQHGFDEWYGLPYSNDMWPYHPKWEFPDLPTYEGNRIVGYNLDQSNLTAEYTERSVRFIRANRDRPFFLYLAHSMPHVPLAVSERFRGRSGAGLYGDVMMELDWSVGEVMRTLREEGLDRNTLVVFTSDNGPWIAYGNHAGSTGGLREAKATTFEGGLRVPMVAWWKGTVPAGTVCNRLTSNIDLLPTFARIADAPLPPLEIDGVSLLPLLRDPQAAPVRDALALYYQENSLEAVTDGLYKLVFPHDYLSYGMPGNDGQPGEMVPRRVERAELYDLRRDPGERYDVAAQHPEVVARLDSVAWHYRAVLGDDLTGAPGSGRRKPGSR